jgi:hypothetical protein
MAIKYLVGLDIDGNIDLNSNQIKEVRIDNLASDPTGSVGRLYYNTTGNVLKFYNGSAWIILSSATDTNTTYDLSGVGAANGTAGLRLAGSDASIDDVLIVGAGTVGVTRSGNTLTVTGTDSAVGTVTDVSGGTGITITGTSSVTPTVNIDTVGLDNAIEVLVAADPVGADYVWFSDVSDSNTLRKTLISAMPGFGKDGTVTEVDSGAGLTGGAITTAGTLAVDYAGVDNVVLAASDGTAISVVATDKLLISDATDSNAKFVNISQITAAIGGGTVTSIDVSGGTTGLTTSGGAVTTSGTITLAGTLIAGNGGTGQSSYTLGDILYASGTGALSKLGIGSTGQVLKVASGIPSWAADANAGGTVTTVSSTVAGDAIGVVVSNATSTPALAFTFTGSATDYIDGAGDIAAFPAIPQGTVTSVTASNGAKVTGTATTVPNVEVDYTATGVIASAGSMSGNAEADDLLLLGDDSASGVVVKAPLQDIPLNVLGSPIADLSIGSNKLTAVATGTVGTDGVNLAQVQAIAAGVGVFQGGYNATTNVPALTGASNVALVQGDFYVVTVDGSFFTETVEVGDLIFANGTIAAGSSPALSAYTVVISDANIAGVGATDGATEKGVAGFSSATFAGTASGFITVKAGGISNAQLAETYNTIIGTDTDLNTSAVDVVDQINVTDGVITSMSKRTLPNAATGSVGVTEIATQAEVDAGTDTFRYVTPATLASHINADSYTATFPATTAASTSIAAATHGLGTGPLIVQCYVVASGAQVQLDVTVNPSTGAVTLATTSNQTANTLRVAMVKVR